MKSFLLTTLLRATCIAVLMLVAANVFNPTYAQTERGPLKVITYASPDPDSVNTHFTETDEGFIVVGAQRTFSEAERALARIQRTGKPVVAMFITVPHTDHFGGLKIFADAFPDAAIYASRATISDMRSDEGGYIKSRKELLGDDFPSLDVVQQYLPGQTVKDGDVLDIGGVTVRVLNLPNNNASMNTLLYLPNYEVLFGSEVVENAVTAFMKDANLDNWISQVTQLTERFPDLQMVYGAHNFPGPADYVLETQKKYLVSFRSLVADALAGDDRVSPEERTAIVAEIEQRYPDFQQVARVERAELISQNVDWVAGRLQNQD